MSGSFRDLREFIDALRRSGDLAEVEAEVDADQEVAEIHRRVIAAGGPALLFNRVKGADFPLVTNLFGTAQRAELAFGENPFRVIQRLTELVDEGRPRRSGRAPQGRPAPAVDGKGSRDRVEEP